MAALNNLCNRLFLVKHKPNGIIQSVQRKNHTHKNLRKLNDSSLPMSWHNIASQDRASKKISQGNNLLSVTVSVTQTRHYSEQIQLTSERYSHIRRGEYGRVTDVHIAKFRELLTGEGHVLVGDDVDGYNLDWLRTVRGNGSVVLRPTTTEEVSSVLRYCNEHRLAVVPQGGNTGLVGGSVPVFDEIVLSTQLMNKVINVNPIAGTLHCEAGCVLQSLDDHVSQYGLMMPYDLGAKGSCQIGGNVATNAGGIRLLRYGSLHGSVLGLEAVLADGTVIDCQSEVRKDNTGYDIKQLFIGSEGHLGVITKVIILCPAKPTNVQVAFLGCADFESALRVLDVTKRRLGEILSAFEYFDNQALNSVTSHLTMTCPLSDTWPHYLLIETSGSNAEHDEAKINSLVEELLNEGLVSDGTIATDGTKIQSLWALRERISESLLHDGYCHKYDISVPHKQFYNIVTLMSERLGGEVKRVTGYGHLGDGNLHLNITDAEFKSSVKHDIEEFLYPWIRDNGGSISAEHGLGFMKSDKIHYSKQPETVALMRKLKAVMDPNGILNPYKILPKRT